MRKTLPAICSILLAFPLHAATVIDVVGRGNAKDTVSIKVDGVSSAIFAKTLKKNLELSGCFLVGDGGAISVSGTVGGEVSASGRGKVLRFTEQASDDASARMAARKLSDSICETFAGQKGFACDKVVFLSRKGPDKAELCTCYPDGQDIKQITADGKAAVGPRWKDGNTVLYTGFVNGGPEIWEIDVNTGRHKPRWNFKGLSTGAAVSPDGTKAAIILSFQGNPELYVIDMASSRWQRMTNTPNASEGQPAWSPDGKKIVYVSDESRHPQLYIVDVATKSSRRLTSKGTQNVDPDWGGDGRIAYTTKRGGQSQIAVIDPAEGEASARLVTGPGSWERPSWARDMRHVVAGRDKALFVVDTLEDGDEARQLFVSSGNWCNASWSK
ncbi:MAG: PD40 domain-containing protein [Kiritimatiellae bacterium]|nr:PD40 domain-containing protein [Kiritimatiellia bacterium]